MNGVPFLARLDPAAAWRASGRTTPVLAAAWQVSLTRLIIQFGGFR